MTASRSVTLTWYYRGTALPVLRGKAATVGLGHFVNGAPYRLIANTPPLDMPAGAGFYGGGGLAWRYVRIS